MTLVEFAKDFAGPAATTTAAIVAASIAGYYARQQARTARLQATIALDKLKYDTFERRLAVLTATRELMKLVVNVRPGEMPDVSKMWELRRTIETAKYLFSDKVNKYLDELVEACFDTPNYTPETAGRVLEGEERESLINRGKAMKKVVGESSRLPKILEDELSLNFLKSGPK